MTSRLPEPNFIDRNPEQITREWIALYEQKTGKVLQPAQIERLLIDVCAYRETMLRVNIQETAKQNLLSYAPLDILRHIGEPLGVEQLLAGCACTMFRFSIKKALEFDFAIPSGTDVETKDGLFVFTTTVPVIMKAGTLSVDVRGICKTAGATANRYISGSINNLLSPLSQEVSVENITTSDGGVDDEDADSLRERIRQAPEKFSNAGSKGAYRYHTFSAHQSIIDAAILSPSPGVVRIYPLTDTGSPGDEVIAIVQEYLSDEKVRPLTDFVEVKSAERVGFSINAHLILYTFADAPSVMKTIEAKLAEYKTQLREKLGKSVITTQIIAILNSVYGVFRVDLKMPGDIIIQEHQWADLIDFEIVIGGYANE